MTTEEAKKAGFRSASGALYVYWCIENGHIYVRSCDACALTGNDFPTRAKAREALRKCKLEAAAQREDARIAARKAAGTQVPPTAPSETPAERDARIKALVDGYIAKGGPITAEQLTDEVSLWCDNHNISYYNYNRLGRLGSYWNKPDAEHAKWLADMQAQTTPITPEQAKMLRDYDTVYHPSPIDKPTRIQPWPWGKDDACSKECLERGTLYFTRAAAQAALGKAKAEAEPLEWCERKEGDTIDWSSDEITWDNKGKENWQHPTPFSGLQPKVGDLCDELGIIRARYRNPLWLAKHGKPVESRETPVGETQGKEVITGETQPKVGNKYHRTIHGVSEGSLVVDVYNVLDAFGVTCPACQHAIKKLLCAGLRNKGSRLQDLTEAAESTTRAVTLEKQREQ